MHKNSARGLLLLESTSAPLHQKLSNHMSDRAPALRGVSGHGLHLNQEAPYNW